MTVTNLQHGHCIGDISTPTYAAWTSLRNRCDNPNNKDFKNYGERGITYCVEWKKFENFLHDMGEKPGGCYSIDRIDNSKGYSKENCQWATRDQQQGNKRVFKTSSSKITGVSFQTKDGLWVSYGMCRGERYSLYCGRDFFEACCARKSWENRRTQGDLA